MEELLSPDRSYRGQNSCSFVVAKLVFSYLLTKRAGSLAAMHFLCPLYNFLFFILIVLFSVCVRACVRPPMLHIATGFLEPLTGITRDMTLHDYIVVNLLKPRWSRHVQPCYCCTVMSTPARLHNDTLIRVCVCSPTLCFGCERQNR